MSVLPSDGIGHRRHPLLSQWRHRLPDPLQAARGDRKDLRRGPPRTRELLVDWRDFDYPDDRARPGVYFKEFLHGQEDERDANTLLVLSDEIGELMLVVCETLTKIYCFNGGNERNIRNGSKLNKFWNINCFQK